MEKAHVWNLRRPAVELREVVLTDPRNNPDFRAVLTVKEHDAMSTLAYLSRAEDYIAMYVTGIGSDAPVPLPPVNGEPLEVTEEACRAICCVLCAQAGDEKSRYTFEELAAMCVSPVLSAKLARLASELGTRETGSLDEDPNPTAKPTEGPSG